MFRYLFVHESFDAFDFKEAVEYVVGETGLPEADVAAEMELVSDPGKQAKYLPSAIGGGDDDRYLWLGYAGKDIDRGVLNISVATRLISTSISFGFEVAVLTDYPV